MENSEYLKLRKVCPLNTLNNNVYKRDYTFKSRNESDTKIMEHNTKDKNIIDKIALGLSLTARARTKV
jgi:hypothetical protein